MTFEIFGPTQLNEEKTISLLFWLWYYEKSTATLYLALRGKFRIRSFSGPYFPALGLNTERYEYGHFLHNVKFDMQK